MRFLFVINPYSGKRRSEKVKETLQVEIKKHNLDAELWMWDDIEAIEGIMRKALEGGYDAILAAGGDGTFHHVAKRLVHTGIPVGIVPVGTGNALSHHFRLPSSISGVVDFLPTFKTVKSDTACLNGLPYFAFFGIGMDAVVAHRFSKGNQRSFAKYVYYSLSGYANYKPELLRVTADGKTFNCRPHMFSILNTSEFGSGAKMAVGASVTDGLLDVVWVNGPPIWTAPEVMWRIFNGKLDGANYYSRLKAKHIIVERETGGPAQVDGEAIFTEKRIEITCEPRSLDLMVPAGFGAVV